MSGQAKLFNPTTRKETSAKIHFVDKTNHLAVLR